MALLKLVLSNLLNLFESVRKAGALSSLRFKSDGGLLKDKRSIICWRIRETFSLRCNGSCFGLTFVTMATLQYQLVWHGDMQTHRAAINHLFN